MILSVSRRTDILACYPDWFFQRLSAGEVLVRGPMNPRSVARIALAPDTIEGIVLWTKNPAPLLGRMDALSRYPYYVQVTANPYGTDIEAAVPGKGRVVLPAMRRLSDALGPERVHWRYDPVLLTRAYTEAYHIAYFERMARQLEGAVTRCVIGFINLYQNTRRNARSMGLLPSGEETMRRIARALGQIGRAHGMELYACMDGLDFTPEGILKSHCVDAALLSRIGGVPLDGRKDPGQRPGCGCARSVDIGAYNTCTNGCGYCYANYDAVRIPQNARAHDPAGALLTGRVGPGDRAYDRAPPRLAIAQTSLLDGGAATVGG